MYIKSYANIIDEAVFILNNVLKNTNDDIIVIGDNASGKSDVLRTYAQKIVDECYYIDAVNRSFNQDRIASTMPTQSTPDISSRMISIRLERERFNLSDWFGNNDYVERWFPIYRDELERLSKKFFEDNISFREVNGRILFFVNDKECRLSSGYQAMFRIFAELTLCRKFYTNKELVVIIDELDEFLSVKNAACIFNYIRSEFSEYRFVITTHSADMLVKSNNYRLMVMQSTDITTYDGNEFDTLTMINTLFNKLFFTSKNDNDSEGDYEIDEILARLLNHRLSGFWTEIDKRDLVYIKNQKLTGSQQMLYAQIKEWNSL